MIFKFVYVCMCLCYCLHVCKPVIQKIAGPLPGHGCFLEQTTETIPSLYTQQLNEIGVK